MAWSPSPAARGRMQDSVLAARSRPSFCSPLRQGRLLPLLRGKRSAERRMPIMSALRKQVYAVCATHLLRGCAPLSGARPPFGAHACGTRHRLSPRWLSSRTGFPQGTAFRSFARSPHAPCVKHAPCGPVFLPVDRGPGAARVRMGNSARGDRISLRLSGLPFRKGALGERDRDDVTETETSVKRCHRSQATSSRVPCQVGITKNRCIMT